MTTFRDQNTSALALEPILGTSKDNPNMTVSRNRGENKIYLYFGLELLEVIPDDRNHPRFKLMVAQLYNAKVKATALSEVFGYDRKTMKSWGEALLSGDPERLIRVLAGRSAGRKLTTEVKAFVKFRFQAIYPDDKATYSKRIRQEIREVFAVSISSEALRPLFNDLKAGIDTRPENPSRPEPSEDKDGEESQEGETTETGSKCEKDAPPTASDPSPAQEGNPLKKTK